MGNAVVKTVGAQAQHEGRDPEVSRVVCPPLRQSAYRQYSGILLAQVRQRDE